MSADPACRAPVPPEGAVPRTCVPFAHVPAVPAVMVPYVPVPVPSGLPVLSVAGILPDRTGNVDVTRFLEEWAAGPLAGKADKAPPSAAGNLASLAADGNLVDSGATPESIKAAAVAEVVANAPGTMDTLKEIADILGSSQQSGTVLKRISDLESGKRGLTDVAVYENGYTDWEFSDGVTRAVSVGQCTPGPSLPESMWGKWALYGADCDSLPYYEFDTREEAESALQFQYYAGGNVVTATRSRAVVPTQDTLARASQVPAKTSQLTNDGDGTYAFVKTNDSRLLDARTPTAHAHAIADVTGLGAALAQKANASDLPYRLVEPGKWEFSGFPVGTTGSVQYVSARGVWELYINGGGPWAETNGAEDALGLTFVVEGTTITATRPSLPGHLADRAGNRVVVSGDTTLTLPAVVPGYLRDFLVRLEISGSTVPTITFSPDGNESVTYETDGDAFPVPDEAGDWLYSFTESCVAHRFAVSLKKVNTVAVPQAQGGS